MSAEPTPPDAAGPLDPRNELSEFLRTRRARLQPEDVGLPYFGARRRVPGLRREELAQLAGVSAAYYTRLEQGNAHNVSAAVLEAIADALRLNRAEREHLDHLAKPAPRRGRATPLRPQRVRPQLQHLLDAMDSVPAYVLGRRCDILAWNRMACALLGDFAAMPPEQRNMAWLVFMDPASHELYDDWEGKARDVVAGLRMDAGRSPDDPRLAALIGELSVKSPEFRQWWAAHDVRGSGPCAKELHHPVVGRLSLAFESLVLPADPDQMLVTYAAEPGSAASAWPSSPWCCRPIPTRCWSPTRPSRAPPRRRRCGCSPAGPRTRPDPLDPQDPQRHRPDRPVSRP